MCGMWYYEGCLTMVEKVKIKIHYLWQVTVILEAMIDE